MTRAFAIAAVAVVWIAGFVAPDLHLALLYCTPALLLTLALTAGVYPGERLLERFWKAPPHAPRGRTRSLGTKRRPSPRAQRGGLLLATRLAGRAPPALHA